MTDLTEAVIRAVQAAFPDLEMSFGGPPNAIVRIAPAHPAFGSIEVEDDGPELTVHCGNFTHVHLSNYDEGISSEERITRMRVS